MTTFMTSGYRLKKSSIYSIRCLEMLNSFLKTHHKLEFNKNGYWYLLNITEYRLPGEEMPYDFARAQIQEILTNSNRLNFDRELEENLYRDAEKSGDIKWLYKGEKSIEKESIK